LCNMATPLIDQYTRPRTYGHKSKMIKQEEGK